MITRKQFLEGGLASLLALQYSEIFERSDQGTGGSGARKELSVREAIARRRTVRGFSGKALDREQFMDVLWAAQGITDKTRGLRAVPSAGALYPLEVFGFLGPMSVSGMKEGVYRYRPHEKDLLKVVDGDLREELARACLSQMWIAQAPVSLVICAVYARTTKKYGERGVAYALIESGCAAQSVFLMAGSLGLGAGIVGAFEDVSVHRLTGAADECYPLLVMPVGYRA